MNSDDNMKKIENLLKQNLRLSHDIYESVEKTRKYILWLKIFNIIKIVLVLLPLVIALIFLPKLISTYLGEYTSILDQLNSVKSGNVQDVNPDIIKQLLGL